MGFAEKINRICADRGTTLTALVKKVKGSSSFVTAINKGSLPKESELIEFAKELHCDVSDFFEDELKPMDNSDIKFALFGGDKIDEITDEMYEDVLRYAQFLKEKKMKDI